MLTVISFQMNLRGYLWKTVLVQNPATLLYMKLDYLTHSIPANMLKSHYQNILQKLSLEIIAVQKWQNMYINIWGKLNIELNMVQ